MMRSLWTAASGMIAQQNNVDTISNNLANVNTIGYKKETAEFKSLLYQTIQTKTTSANGEKKPISAQVGLGTRNSSITSHFNQGSLQATEEQFDFAIDGDGFFQVRTFDGGRAYTRAGNFLMAEAGGNNYMLCDTDGRAVLSTDGSEIIFPNTIGLENLSVSDDGRIYLLEKNELRDTGFKIGLYQFPNPSGLSKSGSSLLMETAASGVAMNEDTYTQLKKSRLKQGYIEMSNVQVADEMVNLIIAQRAYELNSKAITTSDEMMQTANNLKK